jgi:F420-dependent methylenetetrahydromethanopterin dehydrogenase
MVRTSCRAVVLDLVIVDVVVDVERLKVLVFGFGMKAMPELVEVVIKDNLGAYKEILHGCNV